MTDLTLTENFQALLVKAHQNASDMLDQQALKIQSDPQGGIPKPKTLPEIPFPLDDGWGYTLTITKPGVATSQILAAVLKVIDAESMVDGTSPVLTEANPDAITELAKALSADGAQYTITATEDPVVEDDPMDKADDDEYYDDDYDDDYETESNTPVTAKLHSQKEWEMATWNCSSCGSSHLATHMSCPNNSSKKAALKEFVITLAATQKVKIVAPNKKEAERLAPLVIDPLTVDWTTK